jgi:hypothetical protein
MGEIFNGAITSLRRSPAATLGTAALLCAGNGVLSSLLGLRLDHVLTTGTAGSANAGTLDVLNQLLVFVVNTLLAGLLAVVVGRNLLGWPTTLGTVWAAARPRLVALAGLTGLLLLAYLVLWTPFALALVAASSAGSALGVFVVVLLGIVTVLCEMALWSMLSLAAPALMLERIGPARAVGRAWRLARSSFWRVVGIQVLAGVIFLVLSFVLALPFAGAEVTTTGLGHPHYSLLWVVLNFVGIVIAGSISRPFLAGADVLLYCDLRMRKEGLDLMLRDSAGGPDNAGGGGATPDFGAIWAPRADGPAPAYPGAGAAPGYGQPGPRAW